MKELQRAVRQYQHNDCSGLVMGYDEAETNRVVSELLRERNELAAQVERLRGALIKASDDIEDWMQTQSYHEYSVQIVVDSRRLLEETPARSLDAVKREVAILTLEDYDAALSSFEMTVPEYIKARLL